MDTQTANSPTKEDIDKHVKRVTDDIRAHMPETYKAIQDKSKKIGNAAFLLVRRGIRGEPNCFWAMENGGVVGAPIGSRIAAKLPGVVLRGLMSVLILAVAAELLTELLRTPASPFSLGTREVQP